MLYFLCLRKFWVKIVFFGFRCYKVFHDSHFLFLCYNSVCVEMFFICVTIWNYCVIFYHPYLFKAITVEVMILSRYRYSVNVTHHRPPLPTVTDRYRPLLTVTESYSYLRYKRFQRYINFFKKTLNICSKHTILRSVTLVTVKFGNACNDKIR